MHVMVKLAKWRLSSLAYDSRFQVCVRHSVHLMHVIMKLAKRRLSCLHVCANAPLHAYMSVGAQVCARHSVHACEAEKAHAVP